MRQGVAQLLFLPTLFHKVSPADFGQHALKRNNFQISQQIRRKPNLQCVPLFVPVTAKFRGWFSLLAKTLKFLF